MIRKFLILSVTALALQSCAQDWEVARGPIKKYGERGGNPQEAPAGEQVTAPGPRVRPQSTPSPRPIQGNPFDVPDVTSDLPRDEDLAPSLAPSAPRAVDPQDPGPTLRTTPPSGE